MINRKAIRRARYQRMMARQRIQRQKARGLFGLRYYNQSKCAVPSSCGRYFYFEQIQSEALRLPAAILDALWPK